MKVISFHKTLPITNPESPLDLTSNEPPSGPRDLLVVVRAISVSPVDASRTAGVKPKVVTVAKALLFPASVATFGDRGDGLSTEIWWSPSHPFTS